MKKIIALLVLLTMISGLLPVFASEDFIGTVIYEDDFEADSYTVTENSDNTVKELYKNGELSWTFSKTDGKPFSEFPDDLTEDVSTDTLEPVNLSNALSTADYTMENTNAFLNLPKKYTSGKIMIDMRLKRAAAKGNMFFYITSDEIQAGEYNGDYACNFMTKTDSSSAPNVYFYTNYYMSTSYGGLLKYNSSSTRNKAKGYNYVRLVLDIDAKKVDTYVKTANDGDDGADTYKTVSTNVDWYENGADLHFADGIKGLYFTGTSNLRVDDIKVSYDSGNGAPVASGLKIEGKAVVGETLKGSYAEFEDRLGEAEYGSTCTWRRADDMDFVTNVEDIKTESISAGEVSEYIPTEEDFGKYIQFSVIPRKLSEEFPEGDEVMVITETPVRHPQTMPIVSITSHAGGERYYYGETVSFAVEAECENTTITQVEFYANGNLIGTDSVFPYELAWSPEVNEYSVFARAHNAIGEYSDSESISISVIYDDPIRMDVMYSDNMVLQREKPIKISGKANDNERCIYIMIGDTKVTAPIENGEFTAYLPPMSKGTGYTLTLVSGRTGYTLSYSNVAIGDVWVCSGQSNMALKMNVSPEEDRKAANYPDMRFFYVNQKSSAYELEDVSGGPWTVCTPGNVEDFSAVGFYFGEKLMKDLEVPVGLIYSCKGGTKMSSWITREGLTSDANISSYAGSSKAYLYNGMIAPLTDFTICGVAWYQGESDSKSSTPFQKLNATLIQSWRNAWDQGDFPFVQVQLPNITYSDNRPLARVRENQMSMQKLLPNVGVAVTMDVGSNKTIHPTNKKPVGQRLALLAMNIMYPEMELECYSPSYSSHTIEGNKFIIKFDNVYEGLQTTDSSAPSAFKICGDDKVFVDAQAEITGPDEITVWSDSISNPAAVRYAWSNTPAINLTGGNGLPCCPFRTDDWQLTSTNYAPYAYVSGPTAHDQFHAGDSINITVDAFDCDGDVTKVEIFANNKKIAELSQAPYEYTWENVPAGVYYFTASATDNNGSISNIKGSSKSVPMTEPITVGYISENETPYISCDFENRVIPSDLSGMINGGNAMTEESPLSPQNISMMLTAEPGNTASLKYDDLYLTEDKVILKTRINISSISDKTVFGIKRNGSSDINEILIFDTDGYIKTAFPYEKTAAQYRENKWYDINVEFDLYSDHMTITVNGDKIVFDEIVGNTDSIDAVTIVYTPSSDKGIYFENLYLSSVGAVENNGVICNILPMRNQNDENIYLLKDSDTIIAQSEIVNFENSGDEYAFILAAYKDNKLIGIDITSYSEYDESNAGVLKAEARLDVSGLGADKAKAFVINTNTLEEICNDVVIID